jgi:hypothetical protein
LKDGHVGTRTKFDDAPASFFEGMRIVSAISGVFGAEIVPRILLYQPFFPSCMVVDRKRFLAMGGWDEGVSRSVGCDFATTLRMAANPPTGVVMEPLVQIRKHSENFSADTERMNFGDANVLEFLLKNRPQFAGYSGLIQHSIARRRSEAIDAAFARGDFHAFDRHYRDLPVTFRKGKRSIKAMIAKAAVVIGYRRNVGGKRQGMWRSL